MVIVYLLSLRAKYIGALYLGVFQSPRMEICQFSNIFQYQDAHSSSERSPSSFQWSRTADHVDYWSPRTSRHHEYPQQTTSRNQYSLQVRPQNRDDECRKFFKFVFWARGFSCPHSDLQLDFPFCSSEWVFLSFKWLPILLRLATWIWPITGISITKVRDMNSMSLSCVAISCIARLYSSWTTSGSRNIFNTASQVVNNT